MNLKVMYNIGDNVLVVNNKPLGDSDYAPNLILEENYKVKGIVFDSKGNQHLDVGLKSELNFITSQETGEELPDGNKIHWCHPSRFIKR